MNDTTIPNVPAATPKKAPAKKAVPKKAPAKAKAPAKKKVAPAKPVKAKKAPAGDNKILFTFRIQDTLLADINAVAKKREVTPAALMRGAMESFIKDAKRRGRA